MNVIVLDGNQRSALAVTRSLGKKGINVIVGAESAPSLASSSKYCSQSFLYPSPVKNPDDFLKAVKEYVTGKSGVILFPMTDATLGEILKRKNDFGNDVIIPFPDFDRYHALSDKANLFRIAANLNIPVPRTLFPSDFRDREELIQEAVKLGFPLVIKPSFSRLRTENGWVSAGVRYAQDDSDLRAILDSESFKTFPFIIQERLEGPGIGVFLLTQDGKEVVQFAHKRLREKPPSGGVSVLCESLEPPPVALDSALKLLRHFNWSGVAMVEFKRDNRDNVPKLMEVNARFWGSLQLAVSAGVDFPYLLYRFAKGEKITSPSKYTLGLRSRWELGDLDHLLIRLKKRKSELFLQSDAPSKIAVIKNFIMDVIRPSVKSEVMRLDDISPFLFELKEYAKNIIGR